MVIRASLTDSSFIIPHSSLPTDRLEALLAWGGAVHSAAYVFRPSTVHN